MRMTESTLRRIIRTILQEESDLSDPAAFSNYYDESNDSEYTTGEDIPVGHCPTDNEEAKVGGTHYFHGNTMYPCAGEGVKAGYQMGTESGDFGAAVPANGGPYLGNATPNQEELRIADDYIQKFKPDTLIAYSRGGAVANDISSKASDTVFLAPAWGKGTYGAPLDSINGTGRCFHGGGDRFVPVKNSVIGCKNSGITLYLCADVGHGKILGDFKSGNMQKYKRIDPSLYDDLIAELPEWTGKLAKGDPKLEQQNAIVKKYTTDPNEGLVRDLVRSILLEKKAKKKKKRKVKCPLLPGGKRDYKCEYQKYGGASKKGKKDRAARNKARRQAMKMGLVKRGDGMELDHIMPLSLGGSNDPKNWQVITRSENRKKGKSWDGKAGHMDETQKKGKSKKGKKK